MAQQKLWKGVLIGAFVGGALMMIDRETRQYVGTKSRSASTKCKGYVQHPSEAIHSLRVNYGYLAQRVNNGTNDLLELLRKAEDMLNKVGEVNQEVEQQLEAIDNNSREAS